MKIKKKFFFLLAATVVSGPVCTQPAPPPGAAGPAEAVQDLAAALQKGDTAAAWSLLSQRTQNEADRAAAAARAATDAGPESGKQMLFTSALPGRSDPVRVVTETGDSAEVQAGSQKYRVVRENGRWRVDLDLGH